MSSVIKVLMKLYGKCGVKITRTYELHVRRRLSGPYTSRLTALEKVGLEITSTQFILIYDPFS